MKRHLIRGPRSVLALATVLDVAQLACDATNTAASLRAGPDHGAILQRRGSSRWNVHPRRGRAINAGLGDTDAAFQWLKRSYEERGSFMNGVAVTPAFDALHSDPRWASLMRRMGLEGASRM